MNTSVESQITNYVLLLQGVFNIVTTTQWKSLANVHGSMSPQSVMLEFIFNNIYATTARVGRVLN
jgi:hypothetical protein